MIGVAMMNSIAAYIQKWPVHYQYMNIPHFLMYIAIIYYLCKKEFYTVAWVIFSLITLVTLDFIILSKKIFDMEKMVTTRINGYLSSKASPSLSQPPPPQPITSQPVPSQQPVSQFMSQPSHYTEQTCGSELEYAGMQPPQQVPLPIPINNLLNNPPINTSK
jgi:hypothetical protein